MDRDTVLELIPAYALGALSESERAAVEALLAHDAEAQQLLAEYEGVTELLSLVVPMREAPAHLGDDLRARLAQRPAEDAPPPAALAAPAAPAPPAQQAAVVRVPSWLLASVAALVVVIVGVVLLLSQTTGGADAEALYNDLAQRDDSRWFALEGVEFEGVEGALVVSADGREAVLRVSQLPAIDEDKTIQLWFIDGVDDDSGGLFRPADPATTNYVVLNLDRPVDEFVRFGATIEPAGGSESPTGQRVFSIPIASSEG